MSETSTAPNLKLVFAVRHGKDDGANLSELGKQQITKLADHLRKLIPEQFKVSIISSHATRAKESAQIIETRFGVKHIVSNVLYGDHWEDGPVQMRTILALTDGSEAVIAVTHYEAPSGIAHAFASRFGKIVQCKECARGNGFMVSLETGQVLSDLLGD